MEFKMENLFSVFGDVVFSIKDIREAQEQICTELGCSSFCLNSRK